MLISIFTPLIELLLSKLGTTFKTFLSTFEDLHKTSHRGSSHSSFTSKEEKCLVKQYQGLLKRGEPDPDLLKEISSIALQKAKSLWMETYHDSIYQKLVVHLSELYEVDINSITSFATSFPLTNPPQVFPPEFCDDDEEPRRKQMRFDRNTNAQVSSPQIYS